MLCDATIQHHASDKFSRGWQLARVFPALVTDRPLVGPRRQWPKRLTAVVSDFNTHSPMGTSLHSGKCVSCISFVLSFGATNEASQLHIESALMNSQCPEIGGEDRLEFLKLRARTDRSSDFADSSDIFLR